MDFQNNFKIMKIKKSLIILSIFINCSLTAQEENLINTFTNDASIGINMGVISDISNNTDKITYINYTKHINHVIALQFGGILGSLTNSHFADGLNGVAANGIINLSNLTFGKSSTSLLYVSAGGSLIETKRKGKEAIANVGGGIKYNINDRYQRIDIDISAKLGINPFSDETSIYSMCGLGINYRFNTMEESVEWNNPLDVIYKDITDLKTKLDSTDEAKMKGIVDKIRTQDAKISSNSNDIKNVFNITKSSISQIEKLNSKIDKLKNKEVVPTGFKLIENKITIGYHIIAGSYVSKENAEKQLKQVQSEGFASSNIQESANGQFRVFLESFKNKDEALIKLNKLKASGKSVWLLE
tara:strand:+ start:1152 stop:2222 length:1071 start_codon:yes stop_codon:yes gene_type:complete